jgi:hypothetical protein
LLFTAKQCCPSAASTASVHIETRKKEWTVTLRANYYEGLAEESSVFF